MGLTQSHSRETIISIEGNIGSGKSTLLANLQKHFTKEKIVFLKEPVDDWESIKDENNVTILEKFYQDQEKYSFSFQMMAYISRLAKLKEAVKNNPGAIIITERSLYTDKMVFAKMLFDNGKIELVNYKIYLQWFDHFVADFPVHKVIYVNTNPNLCAYRIKLRSRTGENVIPLDYLISCDEYHNAMLNVNNQMCVCRKQLILNGNIDLFEDKHILKKWILEVDKFIHDRI